MGRRPASLLALLFSLAPAAAQAAPLPVGTITIRALDVDSANQAARGRFYRTADKLPLETRPGLIRKFLLFAEGDRFFPRGTCPC
jgi:hypothetical protein